MDLLILVGVAVAIFLIGRRLSPMFARARAGLGDGIAELGPVGWSDGTEWRVVAPLARADARRVVRHPAFVIGVAITPLMLIASSGTDHTWQRLSPGIALALVPLGWLTIVALNLVALRPRRTGTHELFSSLPAPQPVRSCGLLCTAFVPVGAAAILAAGWVLILPTRGGITGSPRWSEIAAGLLLAAGSVTVGVAVARWLPGATFGVAAAVVTALIQVRFLDVDTWPWNLPESDPLRFLGFLGPVTGVHDATLELRPAGWHLLYLVGLTTVMAGVALARDGLRRPVGALLGTGLLVVLAAGWIQTRPLTPGRADQLAAYLTEPAAHQVCEVSSAARYCAYPDFTHHIADWRERVEATLALVPAATGPARPMLEVVQRPASIVSTSSCQPGPFLLALPAGVAARVTPASIWRADGAVHPPFESESFTCSERDVHWFFLAVQTGAWAVGLPPAPHGDNERCLATGQARAAIALWAGAAATPDGAAILEEVIRDGRIPGGQLITFPGWDDPPMWGVDYAGADAEVALALLDRPATEVRAVLDADWKRWTDPTTTSSALARQFGLTNGSPTSLPVEAADSCR